MSGAAARTGEGKKKRKINHIKIGNRERYKKISEIIYSVHRIITV